MTNAPPDLVVAYLEQQTAAEREWMGSVVGAGRPADILRKLATDIGTVSCQPGFRGCAFINAAAEFPDTDDPVRVVVNAHREWMLAEFIDLATTSGVRDTRSAARQLMLLRDGAMVNGYLGDAERIADDLAAAFESIIGSTSG